MIDDRDDDDDPSIFGSDGPSLVAIAGAVIDALLPNIESIT